MKCGFALLVGTTALLLASSVQAQTSGTSASPGYKGYVEGVAQATFGNQNSQSYGAELGYKVTKNLQVFVDLGGVRTSAPPALGTSASVIAGYLTRIQSGSVSFTVKEPVAFGLVGLKCPVPVKGKLEPYVMGGFGVARITQDVHFFVSGTDVTSNLAQFGVTLGGDLSGDFNKGMLTLGAGAAYPVWERLVLDFQYRYGRVFNGDESSNISRAGLGIGFRF